MIKPEVDPSFEFTLGTLSTETGRMQRSRSTKVGLQHINILHPLDPQPGQAVTITIQAGTGISLQGAALFYTVDGSIPKSSSPSTARVEMIKSGKVWNTLVWTYLEFWSAVIPAQAAGTRVRYKIVAQASTGQEIPCPFIPPDGLQSITGQNDYDQRYLHRLTRNPIPPVYEYRVDRLKIPSWLRNAVIYQIFVDRFSAQPGMELQEQADLTLPAGGTLRGVTSRLEYLSRLGIDCLWLTPINPAPSYHGYDPTDHSSIESRLGNMEDFQQLVEAAHAKGIKVLIDFVANHVSNRHPAFLSAQKAEVGPYFDWFFFRKHPDDYECFYDVPSQPILNTDNPEAREYLMEAAAFWLKFGCDGFRLDHAHGVSHGFWSEFRAKARAVRPDSVMIGEVTDPPAAMLSYTGRMDGVLDFYLAEIMRKFFAFRSISPSQFARNLEDHAAYFAKNLVIPSFLDNHDMNRFLWIAGGDKRRLKLAALCQFTLPQPPIIYYGTEIGLSQRRTVGALEESRLPMPWGTRQDLELLDFYTKLIHLRQSAPEIWQSERKTAILNDDRGIFAYRTGPYLTILNNSPDPFSLDISARKLILTTDPEVARRRSGIHFPAWGGAICEASA